MDSFGPDEGIWHFDGVNALRHHPLVAWDDHGFYLDWGAGRSGPHRWRLLQPLAARQGALLFGLIDKPGWRLGFDSPPPADFAVHLQRAARYGRWIDHVGLWPAVGVSMAIAAAVLFVVVKTPEWVAPLIPQAWEDTMGDAMIGDFGGRMCETKASRAALDKLVKELAPDTPLREVAIANLPMVNAITLPGRRIFIFDNLIQEARSADELAGVLAHEIGHVRHRDTVTALVRQLGLSVVLSGAQSNVGGLLNDVLAMSYSRGAETAADDFSIRALRKADVSPLPTAAFFKHLSAQSGGEKIERAASWMASHPVSADREAAFEHSAQKGRDYRPALDAAEWAALRNACRDDPSVDKSKSGFDFRF